MRTYNPDEHLLHLWKKKLASVKTNRRGLLGDLLKSESLESLKNNIQHLKSDSHNQGSFWRPSLTWVLSWLPDRIQPWLPLKGSRLLLALKEEPTLPPPLDSTPLPEELEETSYITPQQALYDIDKALAVSEINDEGVNTILININALKSAINPDLYCELVTRVLQHIDKSNTEIIIRILTALYSSRLNITAEIYYQALNKVFAKNYHVAFTTLMRLQMKTTLYRVEQEDTLLNFYEYYLMAQTLMNRYVYPIPDTGGNARENRILSMLVFIKDGKFFQEGSEKEGRHKVTTIKLPTIDTLDSYHEKLSYETPLLMAKNKFEKHPNGTEFLLIHFARLAMKLLFHNCVYNGRDSIEHSKLEALTIINKVINTHPFDLKENITWVLESTSANNGRIIPDKLEVVENAIVNILLAGDPLITLSAAQDFRDKVKHPSPFIIEWIMTQVERILDDRKLINKINYIVRADFYGEENLPANFRITENKTEEELVAFLGENIAAAKQAHENSDSAQEYAFNAVVVQTLRSLIEKAKNQEHLKQLQDREKDLTQLEQLNITDGLLKHLSARIHQKKQQLTKAPHIEMGFYDHSNSDLSPQAKNAIQSPT